MRETLKRRSKEFLYDYYSQIVDSPKEYKKITRYEMHDEALEVFSRKPSKLKKLLSMEDLDHMLRITDKSDEEGRFFAGEKFFEEPSGMMLFGFKKYDEKTQTFTMEPNIREYFMNFEYTEEEQEQNYYVYVVVGMVETYGIIDYQDIDKIYADQRDEIYKKYPPMKIKENEDAINYILMGNHITYLNGIVHRDIVESEIQDYFTADRELHELDYYYNMGRYRVPFVNTEGYTNLKHDSIALFRIDILRKSLQMNPVNTPMVEELNKSGITKSDLVEQFHDLLLHTPIWKYGGSSVLDYSEPQEALLPEDMQQDYLTYIQEFIKFGNHKYRLYPKNKKLTDEEAFHILNHIIPRNNIVNMYSKSRFYPKTKYQKALKLGLEKAIKIEMGYAFAYEAGKLLIYKSGFIFEVTGITHPIQDNLPENFLPLMVEVVLIPLIDSITYGISMQSIPALQLSSNIADVFNHEIKTAKRIQSIDDIHRYKTLIQKIND